MQLAYYNHVVHAIPATFVTQDKKHLDPTISVQRVATAQLEHMSPGHVLLVHLPTNLVKLTNPIVPPVLRARTALKSASQK